MNDTELDRALRELPRADLDALPARALRLTAERTLRSARAPKLAPHAATALRYESIALTILSLLQVLFAAARVLT
jgi:hypothetical protein